MTLRECDCEVPHPSIDPRFPDRCESCGWFINPAWVSNNRTMREFFDRLAEATFPAGVLYGLEGPPAWWDDFRLHVEMREFSGRKKFGHSFLRRDNALEATEEAADTAIYALLDLLAARRRGDREEWALALTLAQKAAEAHKAARDLRAHRHEPISNA